MTSTTGSTPGGMPLAYNRAPCDTLKPWITRLGVTSVNLPEGKTIECGTFGEQPILRMIFGSQWSAHTAEGLQAFSPGERGLALYFGPCTKMMRLTAHGSFKVVTVNFAPGGTLGLDLPTVEETIDRILPFDPFDRAARPHEAYIPRDDAKAWLEAAETQLLTSFSATSPKRPHDLLAEFERLCLTDPGASIAEFAHDRGIARRTLERVIRKSWGVTPHFAMRRARALDMAAALLEVALEEDEPEMRLRYFDQSHVTRELRSLLDTTPGRLQRGSHPLLRITMEIRQSRRVEILAGGTSENPRPWRDPNAEPRSVNRTES